MYVRLYNVMLQVCHNGSGRCASIIVPIASYVHVAILIYALAYDCAGLCFPSRCSNDANCHRN